MRAGIAFALLVLACSMGSYLPAFAQHHGSKETAQKPKTDAELIASAMSAGPLAVSKLRMLPSWPSVVTASCERCDRVKELLHAFPMIRTRLELIRCAWIDMALNGSRRF